MTLEYIYRKTLDKLQRAGADSPAFDAIWLMNAVLGIHRRDIMTNGDREVSEKDAKAVSNLTERRILGEPLQYIIGHWEFFGRKFYVGEGVLIPRDDTEVVLHSVFEHLENISKKRAPKILDLCSGSGIIAITLKCRYPQAQVTAVEISDLAIPYLRKNAQENDADINIIHDNIFACVDNFEDDDFDLIISNPPYIRSDEMPNLQKEVKREPSLALDGGEDGCDFYRRIIPMYTPKLRIGGMIAFELDGAQAELVADMMKGAGYKNVQIIDDLGGVHRAINGTLLEK